MTGLIILRAPPGTDTLNDGTDAYLPHRLDGLFSVESERAPHFIGACGCEVVSLDDARAIVMARQHQELVDLGLA